MRLQTKRFILRSFKEEDYVAVTEALNDPDISAGLVTPSYPFYPKHAEDFHKRMEAAEKAGRQEAFVIALPRTEKLCGVVGVHPMSSEKEGEVLAKLGYWLKKEHWGRGVLQEVLQPILSLTLSDLGYTRIVALTNTDNDRSQKVLRTVGFDYLGIIPSPPEETRGTPESTSWELTPALWAERKKA